MANLREFTYPSSDGIHQVHAAEWTPENGGPRAVLQLVHGISEYILRYDGFARFLADHGFVVVGNDHLGHGGTASWLSATAGPTLPTMCACCGC